MILKVRTSYHQTVKYLYKLLIEKFRTERNPVRKRMKEQFRGIVSELEEFVKEVKKLQK